MRRVVSLTLLLVLVAAVLVAGHRARGALALQASPAAVQTWIASLGWWGPIGFVGVLTFRQFLLLPSAVLLTVGGLCFGVALGTLLGFAGIVVSAVMKFSVARLARRRWLGRGGGTRSHRLRDRVEQLGPIVIGLATAHPAGPLAPFHWGAGLSTLPLVAFAVAVAFGAPVRAFTYSLFGASLLTPGSPAFLVASSVLLGILLLPLAHPGLRRRLTARRQPTRLPTTPDTGAPD